MIHQSRRSNRCVHNYHGGIILHASMQCHSSLLSLTELFDAIVRTIERRAPTYGFRGYRGRPAASGALRAIRPRLDIMGVHPYPGCTSRRPVKISEASRRVMNVGASRCVFSASKRRNKGCRLSRSRRSKTAATEELELFYNALSLLIFSFATVH